MLFETPSWRAIRPPSLAEYVDGPDDGDTPYVDAARWVGPNFCRKVAHQAHGRARQAVAAPDDAADAPYLCGLLTLGVAVGAVVGLRDLERPNAALLRGEALADYAGLLKMSEAHAAAADAATKALPRGARGAEPARPLLDEWLALATPRGAVAAAAAGAAARPAAGRRAANRGAGAARA